jgi:hypothetical protein
MRGCENLYTTQPVAQHENSGSDPDQGSPLKLLPHVPELLIARAEA